MNDGHKRAQQLNLTSIHRDPSRGHPVWCAKVIINAVLAKYTNMHSHVQIPSKYSLATFLGTLYEANHA